MPIELDITHISAARLKVIGVGGAGGNAVRTMISRGLENVEFIAANTDSQALMRNPAAVKIRLGSEATRGLGAGANPEVGRMAVEESIDEVREALIGAEMVFITAGMGGGTGTGAAPIIAREAHELGALVVGIVTRPFSFENKLRSRVASEGIDELRKCVDALIVIPNDRILSVVDASVPFKEALEKADEVLYNATKGIADIICREGLINVDFADVATVMRNQGDALMGIGHASGDLRAIDAAQNALNSPILEGMQIFGAKGLLVNITGGSSLTLHEVSEAVSCVQKAAGEEANLIHGVVIDEAMEDEISVTVVATGFHEQEETRKRTTVLDNIVIVRSHTSPTAADPAPSHPKTDEEEPYPYRPAANAEPAQVLRPTGPVNKDDRDVPAIWRKSEGRTTDIVERRATVAERRTDNKENRAESASQPIVHQAPTVNSAEESQPETFLRPRKGASSGGGSSQPAFLRKIMD